MNIYLIERHQGDHDDYRVTPVKAFENYYEAKDFVDICNEDIKLMLEKMEKFNKKYGIGINAFQRKFDFNVIDMMSDEEYNKLEEKKNDEYNDIISTFKHEELEFADAPITYQIKKIELVKIETLTKDS